MTNPFSTLLSTHQEFPVLLIFQDLVLLGGRALAREERAEMRCLNLGHPYSLVLGRGS